MLAFKNSLVPLCDECSAFILSLTAKNKNEVNKRTDTEASPCKEPEYSCSYLTEVESVYAESTEKEAEKG